MSNSRRTRHFGLLSLSAFFVSSLACDREPNPESASDEAFTRIESALADGDNATLLEACKSADTHGYFFPEKTPADADRQSRLAGVCGQAQNHLAPRSARVNNNFCVFNLDGDNTNAIFLVKIGAGNVTQVYSSAPGRDDGHRDSIAEKLAALSNNIRLTPVGDTTLVLQTTEDLQCSTQQGAPSNGVQFYPTTERIQVIEVDAYAKGPSGDDTDVDAQRLSAGGSYTISHNNGSKTANDRPKDRDDAHMCWEIWQHATPSGAHHWDLVGHTALSQSHHALTEISCSTTDANMRVGCAVIEAVGVPSGRAGDTCGSSTVYDCNLNCVSASTAQAWVDDGYCDDGRYGMDLVCSAFDFDGGDCQTSGVPGHACGVDTIHDCSGTCVNESTAVSWIGDGYCDDGRYGIDLQCSEFAFDDGDCN